MYITVQLEDKKIKIDSNVVSLMSSYRQLNRKDLEAGGILIGRENKETGNIIVEHVTEPYDKDKRERYFFYRKDKRHIEIFNTLYQENKSIYAYIGEWHTHPEDYPTYSCIDIKNWEKICKINSDKTKVYYHIIVGNKDIRVWEYQYKLRKAIRIY